VGVDAREVAAENASEADADVVEVVAVEPEAAERLGPIHLANQPRLRREVDDRLEKVVARAGEVLHVDERRSGGGGHALAADQIDVGAAGEVGGLASALAAAVGGA